MSDISTERGDYKEALHRWKQIDDIVYGKNLDDYIKTLNPMDKSAENNRRNSDYKERAVYYGFAGFTYKGLVGAAFHKMPTVSLPAGLEYLAENTDGMGNGIVQSSKSCLGEVVRKGRCGLFVTYPQIQEASREDIQQGIARATIHEIPAQDIINWRYERQGATMRLALVVFRFQDAYYEGYERKTATKYRELAIEEGAYVDRIWAKVGDSNEYLPESETFPLDGQGNRWREIPFIFAGSENNDASIDESPLYDLVRVNIGHYRNSADFEDSVFLAGQPQPWASGIDAEYKQLYQDAGFYIGSGALMPVPAGEQFAFASAPPNPLVKEAMQDKVQQMIALGARIVQPNGVAKTAMQAAQESAANHSVLSLIVANVSDAYRKAIVYCGQYMNAATDSAIFYISDDFGLSNADPQMLMAVVASWNQGALPTVDLWAWMRRHGLIPEDKTDEELVRAIDFQPAGSTGAI